MKQSMPTTPPELEAPYLDKRQAARWCCLGMRTIDTVRSRGDLPFHKIGRKVIFRVADLEAFMESRRICVL